ncbi:MAG: PD-(D/E)XK nuclease domain-containing protein, partial [Succinivibrionaceae bacterium]
MNSEWLDKAVQLREAFFDHKPEVAQTIMIDMLRNFISIRNTAQESYYHAFLSGVLAIASGSGYNLLSDMESGDGYADLRIENYNLETVVIIECKKTPDGELSSVYCKKALEQIDNKHYAQSYEDKGFTVYKYGISFT